MGLRVIFGAIITVALCTWCGLLYSVFASEISQPNPPDPCAGVARVLWSSRVVLRTETVPAAIHVGADGRIAEVRAAVTRAAAAQWASRELRLPLEAYEDGEVISPGVVDSAAHLAHAEHGGIGRTWEGFATGTQAAAAGGVTTVVDLPDLSPTLTSSAAALHQKTEAARGQLHADVGFWGAVTPDHARDRLGLRELLDAGALGLVALLGGGDEHADEAGGAAGHVRAMECSTAAECRRLNARGRADDEAARWRREAEDADAAEAGGLRAVPVAALEAAVSALTPSGRPLLVHSEELPAQRQSLEAAAAAADGMDYASWQLSRPAAWERGAVRALIALAERRRSSSRLHLMRVSDATAASTLAEAAWSLAPATDARGERVPRLTAGTCPHYAVYAAEDAERGDTRLKAAPPLRSRANRDALWRGLVSGEVRLLASDHTPTTLERRAGTFFVAATGISGMQFTLPAAWTAAQAHGANLGNLSKWLSEEPARLAGLPRKGAIEAGRDADLVVWSPDTPADCATVYHRQPGSPYEEAALHGRVRHTLLRGRSVFSDGQHPDNACGEVLLGSTP